MVFRARFTTRAALFGALCAGAVACKTPHPVGPDALPPTRVDGPSFDNPGGMWMPSQMGDHAETLRALGLSYEPARLADPSLMPLAAVVSLGGCSGSFVSNEGLIITNHHCVVGALQRNSTTDDNLLEDGFLAETAGDEKFAGMRAYVTSRYTDVTGRVIKGLDAITDPAERYRELERRREAIAKECDDAKPQLSCRVDRYFEGAQFLLTEFVELKDLRLVYAPHPGVGVFGGEVDNWRWPRHTGDFAFVRAYKGGKPYKPKHHFKVATKPLRPGDFAMVAGYPGRTYRLRTAKEVADAVDWYYPTRIARADAKITVLEALGADDPKFKIDVAAQLRRLHNGRTNSRGMLDGLTKGGLLERKRRHEAELQAWIHADEDRTRAYGRVLADMRKAAEIRGETRAHDAAVRELLTGCELIEQAMIIVRLADERAKPAGERDPAMDGADTFVKAQVREFIKGYKPKLDRAFLRLALSRATRLPERQRPEAFLKSLLRTGSLPVADDKLEGVVERLYQKTKLENPEVLRKLLGATPKAIERSKDPFIVFARETRKAADAYEAREATYEGTMAALRPLHIQAVRALADGPTAPDANGTLRVSFGTVKGYRPTADADPYAPFTTLSQMVAKHTGHKPFAAPDTILGAAKDTSGSSFIDEELGEIPVNFLADLDITGGNSGSATLDARGELIGLAFDGNYESIASDWLFMPDVTRSIHVDIRYVLWIMKRVDNAGRLLAEMGVQ